MDINEEIKANAASNYSAENIQVLEGLEAVRKRPAMPLFHVTLLLKVYRSLPM